MSVITGVGDEVVEVVCVLLVVAVALLAWWSTAARPDRFRTVIVMERTARTAPHQLTIMGRNIRRHLARSSSSSAAPAEPDPAGESGSAAALEAEGGGVEGEEEAAPAGAAQAQEMDRIVDAMDADINVLRHRRLNFFTRNNGETTLDATVPLLTNEVSVPHGAVRDPESNSQKNLSKHSQADGESAANNEKDASPIDASDATRDTSEKDSSKESSSEDIVTQQDVHKVNIKLKYLNDTFREVDGNLEELLKDFKWRHFPRELSGNCRVLLIYNGHVLSDDGSSLRACGLHHNCVVHCLVHPPRTQRGAGGGEVVQSMLEEAGSGGEAGAAPAADGAPPAEPRSWDLENVLMTLVSIVLTIIWFFRCEYSNLFTSSASGALFALTVFYSIAIFGLYFSDTFQLAERRPAATPDVAPPPPPPARDQPAYA